MDVLNTAGVLMLVRNLKYELVIQELHVFHSVSHLHVLESLFNVTLLFGVSFFTQYFLHSLINIT